MKTCLIIGSAECVFHDAYTALVECPELNEHVIAVKAVGTRWPGPLRAWVSLHPSQFQEQRRDREAAGLPPCTELYAPKPHVYTPRLYPDVKYTLPDRGGTSGMYAVDIALEVLKYERVVLAGIPMDHSPYFNHSGSIVNLPRYRDAWLRNAKRLSSHVRSMSGWTRELFGLPTRPWMEA